MDELDAVLQLLDARRLVVRVLTLHLAFRVYGMVSIVYGVGFKV